MVMSGKMQDGMNISFNKSLVMNELPSGDALQSVSARKDLFFREVK